MTDATEFEDAAATCYDKIAHFFEMAADLVAYYLVCPFASGTAASGPCRAYAERGMGSPVLFAAGLAIGSLLFVTIVFVVRAYIDAVRNKRSEEEEDEEEEDQSTDEQQTESSEGEEEEVVVAQKIFKRTSFSSSRFPFVVHENKIEDENVDDTPSTPPSPPVVQRRKRSLTLEIRKLRSDPRCYVMKGKLRRSTVMQHNVPFPVDP